MAKKTTNNTVAAKVADTLTSIEVSPELAERIQKLYDTRHYETQTLKDICETVVRQGTKTLEKRRKDSKNSAIEKAKQTLLKAGITQIEAEEEVEVGTPAETGTGAPLV